MELMVFAGVILLLIVICLLVKNDNKRPVILLLGGVFNIIYAIYVFLNGATTFFPSYILFDSLGKIIYLSYSILFFSLSMYASGYLKIRSDRGNKLFIISMFINLLSAQIACMAQDFGVLWASLEAATLSIAPLIYYNKTKFSIEATWKFILLTSTGIAIALLGTYMLGFTAFQTDGHGTLNILELKAIVPKMNERWLLFSSIFMLLGYASKIGLAPFHWWKPDSYGEAPGLIGGLLSGGLVSISALCFFRIYQVLEGSRVLGYISNIMLILGMTSLVFSAIFIVSQKDIKRVLAYSSVEHVGIIAIGLGIGKMAIFGSLLHVLFNTISKGALFLSAGDIHRMYSSKKISDVRGLLSVSPLMATIFMTGLFAAAGSPPFSLFISEFYIFLYGFKYGYTFTIIAMIFMLLFIFMGFINMGIKVVYGSQEEHTVGLKTYRPTPIMFFSEIFLLLILLICLFYIPRDVMNVIKDCLVLLGVTNE